MINAYFISQRSLIALLVYQMLIKQLNRELCASETSCMDLGGISSQVSFKFPSNLYESYLLSCVGKAPNSSSIIDELFLSEPFSLQADVKRQRICKAQKRALDCLIEEGALSNNGSRTRRTSSMQAL